MTAPLPSPGVNRDAGEPFVGRLAQLESAVERLASARDGTGGLLFVSGEAGVGKTAFVEALLRRAEAESFSICRGRCIQQYGAGESYLPFLDGLGNLLVGAQGQRIATLLRTYAPTWCLHLPATGVDAADSEQTVGATKERMLREMGDVFEAASREAPLTCLFEDLQWADPSSLDLLAHLARRAGRQQLQIVMTLRPDVARGSNGVDEFRRGLLALNHVRELRLAPFDGQEVEDYVEAALPRSKLPADFLLLLQRRTEGHPLFLRELIDVLKERGDLALVDDQWRLARPVAELETSAPESVRGFIHLILDRLSEDHRRTLSYAALIGREFDSPVLASLLDTDELEVEERLEVLGRSETLVESLGERELPDGSLSTRYKFRHSLHQETLYEDLARRKRVLLHKRVAQELQRRHRNSTESFARQIASHYERGRDYSSAIVYLAQAAEHASGVYAYAEAEEHLNHALALLRRLADAERAPQAVALYDALGRLHIATGGFERAIDDYAALSSVARHAAERCRGLLGSCRALFFARRMQEMAIGAHEAIEAAAASGDRPLRIEALALIALVLIEDGGNLEGARPLLEEVIDTARQRERRETLLEGLAYLGFADYWQSDYARAGERLSEARALAAEQRDGFMLPISMMFLGYARANQGRLGEALEILQGARALSQQNRDQYWLPRLTSAVAFVHREQLDYDEAARLDGEALAIARGDGDRGAELSALLNLVVDHTRADDLAAAGRALAEADDLGAAPGWFGWQDGLRSRAAVAEYRLANGELEAAREAAAGLAEIATAHAAAGYNLIAHRVQAEVDLARDDGAGADRHLQAALEFHEQRPAPLLAWRLHATRALALARDGDRAAGARAAAEARELLMSISEGIAAGRARERFLASAPVARLLGASP